MRLHNPPDNSLDYSRMSGTEVAKSCGGMSRRNISSLAPSSPTIVFTSAHFTRVTPTMRCSGEKLSAANHPRASGVALLKSEYIPSHVESLAILKMYSNKTSWAQPHSLQSLPSRKCSDNESTILSFDDETDFDKFVPYLGTGHVPMEPYWVSLGRDFGPWKVDASFTIATPERRSCTCG
jgi:hypothetical protein